ncbi:MAG: DUF2161 family putative PD-(D/E)XK-type phosphodiesterase [Kiloniellales bacterium]|nr:DUF2161 family putative PD-(D/E)XK-type phosphodiesterase [Kiloniellales bacterium]
MTRLRETDLYPPIKRFLEGQGYEVKGEVADCDVVACREGEDPVVVELKTAFSLPLVFQGVRRQALTDWVYLAVAQPEAGAGARSWRRQSRDIVKLCRRLGLGLMTVAPAAGAPGLVEVHLDPAPYRPRKSPQRRGRLLREFQRRVGDPNCGGSSKRRLVTAYRQDALRCAVYLDGRGPAKLAEIRAATGVTGAARMLQRDVYGWFQRVERGVYAVTPLGRRALAVYAEALESLGLVGIPSRDEQGGADDHQKGRPG